jgi:hypothetical protein
MTPKKEDQSDEEIRLQLMRERAERAEQELRSAREILYLAVKMKLEAQEDADRRVAEEREACAKVAEEWPTVSGFGDPPDAQGIAAAIRARGKA